MREIDEYMQHLDRLVREVGWAVQFVGEGDGQPSFAYTVGLLRQYRHPEFVLVGVPPGAVATLNQLGALVRDGQVFHPGEQLEEALPGSRTELLAVTMRRSFEELPMAWRLNEEPVTALQLVWPDEGNRLPWEQGYSLAPGAQPLWGRRGTRPHDVYRLD